eukprot:sb/3473122/
MKKFFKSATPKAATPSTPAPKTPSTTPVRDKKPKKKDVDDDIFDRDVSMTDTSPEKKDESPSKVEEEEEEELGEMVWAKLKGYPWWPAIVCNDPETLTHQRANKQGVRKMHVQFFDQPPSRGWVPTHILLVGPLALRAKFEEMVARLGNADIDIRS